jgi:hypothetical protein
LSPATSDDEDPDPAGEEEIAVHGFEEPGAEEEADLSGNLMEQVIAQRECAKVNGTLFCFLRLFLSRLSTGPGT